LDISSADIALFENGNLLLVDLHFAEEEFGLPFNNQRNRDFSSEMTGYHMSTSYLPELWFTLPTNGYSMSTPGVESTPRGNINRAGNVPHQDFSFFPVSGIGHRYGGKKSLSIVVLWTVK